jgi:hypothetical protein
MAVNMTSMTFDGGVLHLMGTDGSEMIVRDATQARVLVRGLVHYLRDKGIETNAAPGREVTFTK